MTKPNPLMEKRFWANALGEEEMNNPTLRPHKECKKCYGKGYSSTMAQEIGYPDFIGDEKYVSEPAIRYKFCSCERGKDLIKVVEYFSVPYATTKLEEMAEKLKRPQYPNLIGREESVLIVDQVLDSMKPDKESEGL